MKKLSLIIIALLVLSLFGCSKLTPAQESLKNLREKASSSLCAVAYIGGAEGDTADAVRKCVEKSGLADKYPFLSDIEDENIVILPGEDLFCIVPVSSKATVSVHSTDFDENMKTVIGKAEYSGKGKPILLVCNVSDIFPNSMVSVKNGSRYVELTPYVSLRDGSLATGAPEGMVYDFNPIATKEE